MRVSTAEQNLALQRDALLAAGLAPERIYEDTCSGTGTNRPGLARALDVAREGDTLVILESMKMEMPVEAEDPGTVKQILCEEGQSVSEGDALVVLE